MDPHLFRADLEAKPDSLRRLASIMDSADVWPIPSGINRVVLTGMGSSRYAAEAAALRMRAAGTIAIAEYASADRTLPPDPHTLIVAISATGASRETLDAAVKYQRSGRLVALTNTDSSPLAEIADAVVSMHAGTESGGVACRTYQQTVVLLLDLAARLADQPSHGGDLARRAADATEDLLERRDQWLPRAMAMLDGPDGVYALAPAERLSSAMQSALMVREGPRRAAVGCETGDWAHVDVYLTKTLDYRTLLFPGSRYDPQAMEWLINRGSTVLAVGAEVPGATWTIRYRGDEDPMVRLVTETLIAELVAAEWWSRNV